MPASFGNVYFWLMKPLEVLKSLENKGQKQVDQLRRKIVLTGSLRLGVFLAGALSIYFIWGMTWLVALAFLIILALFLWLVKHHQALRNKADHEKAFTKLLSEEQGLLNGSWVQVDDSSEFKNANHPFANDLNLYGTKSLYSFLNRTKSAYSRCEFAKDLGTLSTDSRDLVLKQKAFYELSKDPEFLFRILADATQLKANLNLFERLDNWLKTDERSELQKFQFLLRYGVPALMIGVALLSLLDLIPVSLFVLVAGIPAFLVGRRLKIHQRKFDEFSDLFGTVGGFMSILDKIQSKSFQETYLKEKLAESKLDQSRTGLAALAKITSAIDSRNNMIVAIVLNIFLMYDYQCFFRIEAWKKAYGQDLKKWLKLCLEFESLASYGIYVFDHPEFVFPTFTDKDEIEISKGNHVLMDHEAVANGLALDKNELHIITGANMAGKSTYLRMVGTSLVLAMKGLPVSADKMVLKPREVFTSMLASDSLGDNESYFFNELKRLRYLMDKLEAGEPQFVILDEILKGTNSKDKAEGSWKFIEHLRRFNSTGLIATHDLSLCEMADRFENIQNRKFEVYIVNDELDFPYTIEQGVCEHMNASFLLEKMGLVESES